jgi:hypothetical protein
MDRIERVKAAQEGDSVLVDIGKSGYEYRHNDSETTHILNYIVGTDTLTSEEKEVALRSFLTQSHATSQKLPKDYESMNGLTLARELNISPENIDKLLSALGKRVALTSECRKVIWEMEKEAGAPKVRAIEFTPKAKDYLSETPNRAAFYDPNTNTVYISLFAESHNKLDLLFSEYAHSQQYTAKPTKNILKGMRDERLTRNMVEAIGLSYDQAQDYEYNDPTTVEYEAHKIIEPSLKREFENRVAQALFVSKSNSKKQSQ